MSPVVAIIATLLLGAFAVYAAGRLAKAAGGEKAGGTAAGVTAVVVLLSAAKFFLEIAHRVAEHGASTAVFGAAGAPFTVLLRADGFSVFMGGVVLALSLLAVLYSLGYMKEDTGVDKFFASLLLMVGSMIGLTVAADAFNLFVFFELMSVSSFVLVAFRKDSWEPVEAGFKYIILSAVGSFLALLGIMLMFMYTGRLGLQAIAAGLARTPREPKLLMMALIMAGFGVKAAVVPLHAWLPDAHSAAPSGISALLSGVVIQTGLFAMLRVLLVGFGGFYSSVGLAFVLFGILTMTVGNITAIQQTDIKRMLAYSSIAQMGYILLGLGAGLYFGAVAGLEGGLFHIMTHAFMKGLAFMCAGALIHAAHSREFSALRGLGWKMPFTAGFFALAGLGLAGVPPLSGFMSKLFIYEAGIKAGNVFGYIVAAVAIVNSVVSLGYYLPAMGALFARDGDEREVRIKEAPLTMLISMGILACLTLALGVWPEFGLRFAAPAVDVITALKGGI